MTDKKPNIFTVLKNIDNFDLNYFKNLTEDEKKQIPPYTLMLWLSSCNSSIQIRQVNAFLNSTVFELSQVHRDLLYKLACISSDGKKKKYDWIKRKRKSKQYSTATSIIKKYYCCDHKTALEYIKLVDYDFIENLAIELGEQDDVLKKLKKELQ